ncbi:ferredoxin [Pusillimonas sp. T2]|uniref:2Fe-2S iron-sulfur cluster-binding protein n=1 Tax=Pusillimonas sp. T2 TaxID=1548123 RepID=UPI000B9C950A|nr:2Fe-2S iron-sulfur cluster-binding protein [Pusillimonas sp. T2]OXR47962.1 ferredoxin [Pusillimonas sp. T2]
MTIITYVDASGHSSTVDLPDGWTLMQGAVTNGIEGVLGECGGSCACATCHCYIEQDRLGELPVMSSVENDMLDQVAAQRQMNSRLACQIKIGPHLQGLRVELPSVQE